MHTNGFVYILFLLLFGENQGKGAKLQAGSTQSKKEEKNPRKGNVSPTEAEVTMRM